MRSSLALLVHHFFGRLFDNEIVSQTGDMRTNVVQALGLVAVPGMFVAFYMLPERLRFDQPFARNWLLIGNCYFFVLYSMAVMGLVAVFTWDALFPDRKDYLILTPLPLLRGAIFSSKVLSLVSFLVLFVIGGNFLDTVLVPVIAGGPDASAVLMAHVVAVASAGAFVAVVFAALQGVLMNVLTGRAFRRISPWVQMAVMGLVCVTVVLTPLVCVLLRPLFERNSPLLEWFPPFWYLGLYLDLLPNRPGGAIFHLLAVRGQQALGLAAAVFALTYSAGYRRQARRVMESIEITGEAPGRLRVILERLLNRWFLSNSLERATFHFISKTILRSARHRVLLAAVAGIAVALALLSVVHIVVRPGAILASASLAGLPAVALTLSFFAITGLRGAFNLPAELRANWIFQVCEYEDRAAHIHAVQKWVTIMALAPLFVLLLPLEVVFAGWRMAILHLSFAGLMGVVLLKLVLIWFRKIPFTCSYVPGKTSMALIAGIYIFGFTTYGWTMADLEEILSRRPAELVLFYAAGLITLRLLNSLEQRKVDNTLIYEDQPDPIVRTLELG
jgi:hypothetical protein